MNHATRNAKGRTVSDPISMADQSQAEDTNINVILRKYGVTGVATGRAGPPQYLDHTEHPEDYRQAIELTRKIGTLQQQLPEQLKNMTLEQVTHLSNEQLNAILAPPKTEPPKEETK